MKNRGDAWVEASEIVFIVVATPVEEVGRDHDFDWAIIEPSSMHSIIQTAGRVNRHRRAALQDGACNVVVTDQNWRAFVAQEALAFVRPGFESNIDGRSATTHCSHHASDLLPGKQWAVDQSLLFGKSQTKFQACDENAQSRALAPLDAQMQPGSVLWWSQWPAMNYPLRDRDFQIEVSLIPQSNGGASIQYSYKTGEKSVTKNIGVIQRIPVSKAAIGERYFGYQSIWASAQKQKRDGPEFWRVSLPQNKALSRIALDWRGCFFDS